MNKDVDCGFLMFFIIFCIPWFVGILSFVAMATINSNHTVCEKQYNVSSCQYVLVPNTDKETLEKYIEKDDEK